jgi:Secretion system C-terminal sorting domain
MKNLLFSLLFLFSVKGYNQVVFADPALNQTGFATISGAPADADLLPLDGIVRLNVPIFNLNTLNALPAGSCKIKIGLGSKLVLNPDFDIANTNTSAYFNWTVATQGGQVQLTGDLIAPLPANYSATGIFLVKGSLPGSSTVTINFLVTNHNTPDVLSDENPNNNTTFLPYTVVNPIPVNFTGINVKKEGCNIQVKFSAENEVNVSHYEIEASKDGIHYTTMGQTAARNSINYSYLFPLTDAIKAPLIQVRVKSVDREGKAQYTEIKTVKGTCDGKLAISLYPNPLPQQQTTVTIRADEGIFNGRLTVSLTDITGKLLGNKNITLNNARQFNYKTGYLAAGQYLIKIQGNNGDAPVVLRFQKW